MEEKMKAFPSVDGTIEETGMNLRDYFAIRIYTTMLKIEADKNTKEGKDGYESVYEYGDSIASDAYRMADEMMGER